ncbi:MAG: hypothetical protein M3Q07_28815, partial [Pseudobdellovibrionaceae bacterium]|nr:hypothetical protein [Pseudobdellovibrionaceae bacterium]
MRCALAFFAMLVILQACSDGSTDRVIHSTIPAETESSLIPTQALIISGSVANGEDASNTAVLQNKEVELIRNDGVVVAQGTTDASANFSVDIAAGALIIDSSFSTATGLAETGAAATSQDFTYTLQVKVPDDGSGRALGVRRKVDIAEESLTTDRKLDIGQTALKEVT